jgi:hypothetical protein
MLLEQPAQMARANPKMLRQRFDPALIEGVATRPGFGIKPDSNHS